MRHEVLYQYDLPVEVLDSIPDTEEVFDVVYARAKSKILIPILITQERILWAYPETVAAYHIYEMQYVDIISVRARIVSALPSTLIIHTVNKRTFRFSGIRNNARSIRKALFSICSQLKTRLGDEWAVTENKTLLYDEYILDKNHNTGNRVFSESNDSDLFEDGPKPGTGCFESNEKIFSHFPSNGEDVFEEKTVTPNVPTNKPELTSKPENKQEISENPNNNREDSYVPEKKSPTYEILEDIPGTTNASTEIGEEGARSKVARIVDTVKEEIRKLNETAQEKKKKKVQDIDDSVVYNSDAGKYDDQWHSEITGDAMILSKKRPWKAIFAQKLQQREYGPEDDDSVILGENAQKKDKKDKMEDPEKKEKSEFHKEDDDSEVYEMNSDIPINLRPDICYPHETTLDSEGRVLHIADNVDFDQVDKILEKLKAQRDAKEITEEEYKARSLRLFKEGK